ncbi:hypothetical protein RHMOL_Rhmol05G0157600 [Rhododendron molle]|uniref:Uncharacterized protein n=1 Tax=Rhododendron molle TaxID=49168 RepID=A0ACC0NPK8_RHOML|nr:hypothetical protein RHMOL_Rhmol05G0157600 [Rhododendron molle]
MEGSVITGRSAEPTGRGGEGRATEMTGAMGPSIESVGLGTVARDSPAVDGGLGNAGGSGTDGGDTGPSQTPPRDSANGKRAAIEEVETTAEPVTYQEADVTFRPAATAATSSSHVLITKYDVAEHLPDELLAKLLEENPIIGEMVLKAKEDRARAIEASEAAKQAKRERAGLEGLAANVEAEERAAEEAQGS